MSTKFLKSSWNGWFLSTKITSISGRIMYDALSRCSPAIVWIVWGCVSASIACAVTDVCKSLFTLFQWEDTVHRPNCRLKQGSPNHHYQEAIQQAQKYGCPTLEYTHLKPDPKCQRADTTPFSSIQKQQLVLPFFGKSPGSSDFPRPTAPLLRPQAPRVICVRTSLERCRRSPRWRARWCWSKRRRRCRRTSAFLRRCFIWFNHGVPREPSRTIQYHTFYGAQEDPISWLHLGVQGGVWIFEWYAIDRIWFGFMKT